MVVSMYKGKNFDIRKVRPKRAPKVKISDPLRVQQLSAAKKLILERKALAAHKRAWRKSTLAAKFGRKKAAKPNPTLTLLPKYHQATSFNGVPQVDRDVYPQDYGCYANYTDVSSVVTPNFRLLKKKKAKNMPLNPYGKIVRKCSSAPYSETSTSGRGANIYNENAGACYHIDGYFPSVYKDPVLEEEAWLKVDNRLADSVNKMHVNVAQMFAERKQTVGLIVNSVGRIVEVARAIKKADFKAFTQAVSLDVMTRHGKPISDVASSFARVTRTAPEKRLANHWLEYTFGWTPFVQDIYGSAELLASHALGELYHERAFASAKGRKSRLVYQDIYGQFKLMNEEIKVRKVVNYRLDSYARAALSSTGMNNPALLAWELLPYSFVVDWFLPVSNYLKKLYVYDGFEFVSGTKSTIWNATLFKSYNSNWSDLTNTRHSSGYASFEEFHYTRTLISSFPKNTLPSFRNPLDTGPLWKFATSAALLRQLFK